MLVASVENSDTVVNLQCAFLTCTTHCLPPLLILCCASLQVCSRNVKIVADKLIKDVKDDCFDLIALPVSCHAGHHTALWPHCAAAAYCHGCLQSPTRPAAGSRCCCREVQVGQRP